ncbi:crossover junction endodeoxyribonuclease RuvC [Kocuria massiliensis]|uniref:crossover junction endodeoxyribonuclease RuvC n=1 Tax=Kocuria TaxID=57493 RepID=UPI0006608ADC|nr:crossover junction endodeoxyribonuclease RuvC [Kocuria sp. HSID16901]
MSTTRSGPVGAVASTASNGPLRILGVDPGLTRCGFGVVDMAGNRKAHFVDAGVAGTQAADALDARVLHIQQAMQSWLETYQPDVMAIERVFAQESVNTVIGTAHASGVVIAAAASAGVPVAWHTPSEVKAAVTGSGRADKASVGRMVTRILNLDSVPKPADAADALALAICHGWRSGVIGTGINMSTNVQTHQGSVPKSRASGGMTPAQRAWKDAEEKSRRGR